MAELMTGIRKDVLREWVKALRSDAYLQTAEALRWQSQEDRPRYCCLGVLCEIGIEYGMVEREGNMYRTISLANSMLPDRWNNVILPPGFADWIGISSDPFIGDYHLTNLNDEGTTFADLADLIERQYL